MPKKIVIDSSVAAKWFLRDNSESDVELADEILLAFLAEDIELCAPRIFTYEMGGLLTKAAQNNKRTLTKTDALEALNKVFSLTINIAEAEQEEEMKSLQTALDFSKSYWDMCYLTLAEKLDCQWCTADDKILMSVSHIFPSNRVQLLSDLR
jgi:predicted nucleic acid-binding protein